MKDKDCCTYECNQGRDCPVRRVRAGGPPPDDQISYWIPDQPAEKDNQDLIDFMLACAVIVSIVVLVVFAYGSRP